MGISSSNVENLYCHIKLESSVACYAKTVHLKYIFEQTKLRIVNRPQFTRPIKHTVHRDE